MANLNGPLTVCDLTTPDRVLRASGLASYADSGEATILERIKGVSARFVQVLGLHALAVERTEDYRARLTGRMLTLDAKPVAVESVTIAEGRSALDDADPLDPDEYDVHEHGGWISFRASFGYDPTFVRVVYTGGLAPETTPGSGLPNIDALEQRFGSIVRAANLQVMYEQQRNDSLGGNLAVPGGISTAFSGEYGLLKEVQDVLFREARG